MLIITQYLEDSHLWLIKASELSSRATANMVGDFFAESFFVFSQLSGVLSMRQFMNFALALKLKLTNVTVHLCAMHMSAFKLIYVFQLISSYLSIYIKKLATLHARYLWGVFRVDCIVTIIITTTRCGYGTELSLPHQLASCISFYKCSFIKYSFPTWEVVAMNEWIQHMPHIG